jgi:hypothetical protein
MAAQRWIVACGNRYNGKQGSHHGQSGETSLGARTTRAGAAVDCRLEARSLRKSLGYSSIRLLFGPSAIHLWGLAGRVSHCGCNLETGGLIRL